MNNLKDTIQKNFDKEKNYNIILSKIERRDNMKVKLSYVLASSLVAVVLLVGVIAYNVPRNNNDEKIQIADEKIELNINKAKSQSMMKLDADIQEVIADLNKEFCKTFPFTQKELNAPKDLKNNFVNRIIMTKENFTDKKYTVTHDYIWDYSNKEKDRTIRIAFSKVGKPLRDYHLSSEEKISKIEGTDVIITQYEKLYLAEFKLNDVYFDTETVIGMTNKNHQAKRKEIQKQFDKQERIKQKRKRKIKRFLKWTSLICIIAGGTTFALVSPIFNIQEIEVIGNNIVTSETIESISEINKEQNIFKFFNKKVVENVKKNPYIETAKVKRKLPNKVQIQVEERERTFNIEFMNGYAYINNQGYILEISQEKLDLPVIQGAKTPEEKIVPGNRLEKEDLEKLETAITITKIWKNNEIEQKITSIDITDRLEYTMYIEEEKQKILMHRHHQVSY